MSKLKNKKILIIILIFSTIALASAYFIEKILGYKPCNLCLIERIPYFGVIIIITLSLLMQKFERFFLLLISFIFFIATVISIYHFGIEQGFFTESFVCESKNQMLNLSKEDLLKELSRKPISCKEVNFRFFGLSLATINSIVSLILSIITIRLFFNYEKNK